MGYGYTAEDHAMRVPAWTMRLQAGVAALQKALRRGDHEAVMRASEDVSWWQGRLTGELISAGPALSTRHANAAIGAIIASQRTLYRAAQNGRAAP
jgi:hypothetical protein